MRFLYFTHAHLNLSRAHVFNILKTSEALGKHTGESVLILAPHPRKKISESELLKKQSISAEYVDLKFYRGAISGLILLIKLKNKFDIFYYRAPHLLLYALIAKLLRKCVFVEVHRLAKHALEKPFWFVSLSSADGVITITNALAKRLTRFSSKIGVVFCNTYEKGFFDEYRIMNQNQLREKLDLPKNDKLIMYTGKTFSFDFNHLFGALKDTPDVYLALVGVTNYEELNKLVKSYNIEKKVTLRKRVHKSDIPAYLLAADVLVVPTGRQEPGYLPIKIFEYMGTGKPIVSFKNECISEILADGENAALVDPSSIENWKEKLIYVLGNDNFAKEIGNNALNGVDAYTWGARAEQIQKLVSQHI